MDAAVSIQWWAPRRMNNLSIVTVGDQAINAESWRLDVVSFNQ
jgi:hypothetical protein